VKFDVPTPSPLLYVIKSQMHIGGEGRVIGAPDVPSKTFVKSFADKNAIQHNLRDPLEFSQPQVPLKDPLPGVTASAHL
jgi:hypothetical protein